MEIFICAKCDINLACILVTISDEDIPMCDDCYTKWKETENAPCNP